MNEAWHSTGRINLRYPEEAVWQWEGIVRVGEKYSAPEEICNPPVEIGSGAIIRFPTLTGTYYCIDANTSKGLRKFLAREISLGDAQSDVNIRHGSFSSHWGSAPITLVYLCSSKVRETFSEERPAQLREEPQAASADLLLRLADNTLSRDGLRTSILEAEVASFDVDEANLLKPLLRRYIEQSRDSTDQADLVAVASAIRKYVGILGRDEISSVGFVLEPGHRAPVQPELELEVTKMLVRKLGAILPREANSLPELSNQLMDLARTYLNPRLLPRQHHGAIALNSILGVTLLRSPGLEELSDALRRLPVLWFKQLVVRRADMLKEELARRFPGSEFDPHRESLDVLIRAARQAV